MKEVTRLMINEYKLKQLKFDFMGYTFDRTESLSFHHLIVPRRHGGPMTKQNGAILRQNTSHDYLHRIEGIDFDMFCAITSEMLDENIKGYLDIKNLKKIRDILLCFEREYSGTTTKKGKKIIKPEYIERRIVLK